MQALENSFEKMLFASRWLLAPFYLGLVGAIVDWLGGTKKHGAGG